MPTPEVPHVVAIVNGNGGTTFEALVHASQAGFLGAVVTDVIFNNRLQPATDPHNHVTWRVHYLNEQYAEQGTFPGREIKLHHISNATHPGGPAKTSAMITDQASEAMCQVMEDARASLGMLLGYLKQVRGPLLQMPLTNNHPARTDITQFWGLWGTKLHSTAYRLYRERAIDYTAFTFQRVHPEYNMGETIGQVNVPILFGDTPRSIGAKVQATEKIWTPGFARNLLQKALK